LTDGLTWIAAAYAFLRTGAGAWWLPKYAMAQLRSISLEETFPLATAWEEMNDETAD
jgi:hypothetical protein